jgi:membrane-associated phospholipid phosphatase
MTFRSRLLKVIAFLPGPLVAVAVVITGNHYVIDVLVGLAVTLVALQIVSPRTTQGFVPARPRAQPSLLQSAYRLRR